MRISIIAVGKLKRGPEKDLVETYRGMAEAMGRKAGITSVTIREIGESRLATPGERRAEEGRSLLAAAPSGSTVVALDERGKDLTSTALTSDIGKRRDGGIGDLAFLIGGPDGHDDAVRKAATLTLSLGRLTWPHRLARIMVAEQIYRAVTILINHPYHRG